MGTGSFPGVNSGRGVLLTTHPLLVPRSWNSRAIPLPTFWATPGLWRDHFTFTYIYIYIYILYRWCTFFGADNKLQINKVVLSYLFHLLNCSCNLKRMFGHKKQNLFKKALKHMKLSLVMSIFDIILLGWPYWRHNQQMSCLDHNPRRLFSHMDDLCICNVLYISAVNPYLFYMHRIQCAVTQFARIVLFISVLELELE